MAMNYKFKNKKRLATTACQLATVLLLMLSASCKKDLSENSTSNELSGLTGINKKSLTLASTSNAVDITANLPKGYVKDGSKDYTTYLQKAINANSNILFPAFPVLINGNGLKIGSNKTITFPDGSQLIMMPNNLTNYSVLTLLNADNVTLNNPVVIGDRDGHLDSLGQWGQGISVRGSSNVTINNANVSKCWGDGIYLSAYHGINNRNITLINPYCTQNRRNGMSITNAIGLDLETPYAGYSNGASPYCGIDIEAETYADELQNIVVNNAKTEHNPGAGIQLGFRSILGGSNKTIGITINSPMDKSSAIGLKATCTLTRRKGNEVVTGDININNPYWRKNSNTPIATNLLLKTIKVNIVNPMVQDVTGKQLSDSTALSIFTYKTHINREANYSITF
jgi:hypothetical protein